jgi:hypothetical protein
MRMGPTPSTREVTLPFPVRTTVRSDPMNNLVEIDLVAYLGR